MLIAKRWVRERWNRLDLGTRTDDESWDQEWEEDAAIVRTDNWLNMGCEASGGERRFS